MADMLDEIKRQIAYWEHRKQEAVKLSKDIAFDIKTMESTIKNLKTLLPKEKTDVVKNPTETTSETIPS